MDVDMNAAHKITKLYVISLEARVVRVNNNVLIFHLLSIFYLISK